MLIASVAPAEAGGDLTVTDFGARGDGLSNDSNAFQAAIDAAWSGATVVVPPATYRLDSTVHLKSGVTLAGPGAVLDMPRYDSSDGRVILDASDTSNASVLGLTLRSEHGPDYSNIVGVLARDSSGLSLLDLQTENLKFDIRLKSSSNVNVADWVSRGDVQSLTASGVSRGSFANVAHGRPVQRHGTRRSVLRRSHESMEPRDTRRLPH